MLPERRRMTLDGAALQFQAYLMVLVVLCAATDDGQYSQNRPEDELQSQIDPKYKLYKEPNVDHGFPIILWWAFESLFPGFQGMSPNYVVQCGDDSCHSTNNRSLSHHPNTRGFMFYGSSFEQEDLPLPRLPRHEWALFHEESPLNNYILSHDPLIELFNHTATFRMGSDFPLTSQSIYTDDYLTTRQPVPLNAKNKAKMTDKLAPVLYVQSHCDIPSDRDRYVQELMKYIDVDSYGECLHNKDLPKQLQDTRMMEEEPFLDFISRYKFHIAFENAKCEDYMTEKLMRTLLVGSVPVYRGASSAAKWMPNNKTIIMADNFHSPKDLAAFIKNIDGDDDEYESYLTYKMTGITNQFLLAQLKRRGWDKYTVRPYRDGFEMVRGFECMVCKKIHERLANEKDHERDPAVPLLPPKMADSSHLGCPQPYPSIGTEAGIPKYDRGRHFDWVGIYWQKLALAQATRDTILAEESDSTEINNRYICKYSPHRNIFISLVCFFYFL